MQKAAAVFNFERLDFVNGWYIRHLKVGDVAERMRPYLEAAQLPLAEYPPEYVLSVAALLQERLKHFDETEELAWFFFKRPVADATLRELIVPKKSTWEETVPILKEASELLAGLTTADWTQSSLEEKLRAFIETKELKPAQVLWPIRAALTGSPASPGSFEMLNALGQAESILRLRAVLQ